MEEDDKPTQSGWLVVTSFTTYGTPLRRYDIDDSITSEDESKTCGCGNHNPMVEIDKVIYNDNLEQKFLNIDAKLINKRVFAHTVECFRSINAS